MGFFSKRRHAATRVWSLLGACLGLGLSLTAGTTVTVHADRPGEPVNRLLLGSTQPLGADADELWSARAGGLWDPRARLPVSDCAAAAKACGVTVMRWPGECRVHSWDWKNSVGPQEARPQFAFGLPEFLTWCRATSAEPFLGVAAYRGNEQDAADLVEYLNSPHNGSNPNGGTDWAAVRAADGHAPPYGVKWFEFDAEAWHGDHDPASPERIRARLAPAEYAERYLRCRAAMRAVDPAVRLGAAVPAEVETWSRPVLERIGEQMDFAVTPLCLPRWERDAAADQSRVLLEAALAAGAQAGAALDRLDRLVEETCGRRDLPLAVVGLGNGYLQSRPVPYRFTLAAALGHAELLSVLAGPRRRVALAVNRCLLNGDWGMLQGDPYRRNPLRRQGLALVYELYAQHFGDQFLETSTAGDAWEFAGAAGVLPRSGEPRPEPVELDELLPASATWNVEPLPSLTQRVSGAVLTVEFPGRDLDYREATIALPAAPGTWYRVRGMIRTENLTGVSGARFEVSDGRRGGAAPPPVLSHDVVGSSDWTEVDVDYQAPEGAERLVIAARRVGRKGGHDLVSGRAHFRVYSVRPFLPPNYGAVPDVGVQAARRRDGTVTVLLVNRNLAREQRVDLVVSGVSLRDTSQARVWLLRGPWPWATNNGRGELLRLWLPPAERTPTGWTVVLPAPSMAAVEIRP